jgi:hypothetical protein
MLPAKVSPSSGAPLSDCSEHVDADGYSAGLEYFQSLPSYDRHGFREQAVMMFSLPSMHKICVYIGRLRTCGSTLPLTSMSKDLRRGYHPVALLIPIEEI